MGGTSTADAALISYLEQHQGTAKYLVVAFGSQSSASIIIASGKPVVTIGGFNGGDNAPTLAQFKQLVASGQLRYVLVSGNGGGGGGMGGIERAHHLDHRPRNCGQRHRLRRQHLRNALPTDEHMNDPPQLPDHHQPPPPKRKGHPMNHDPSQPDPASQPEQAMEPPPPAAAGQPGENESPDNAWFDGDQATPRPPARPRSTRSWIVGGVAAVAIAGGAMFGINTVSSHSASSAAQTMPGGGAGRGPGGMGTQGTITAINGSTITVKTASGTTKVTTGAATT